MGLASGVDRRRPRPPKCWNNVAVDRSPRCCFNRWNSLWVPLGAARRPTRSTLERSTHPFYAARRGFPASSFTFGNTLIQGRLSYATRSARGACMQIVLSACPPHWAPPHKCMHRAAGWCRLNTYTNEGRHGALVDPGLLLSLQLGRASASPSCTNASHCVLASKLRRRGSRDLSHGCRGRLNVAARLAASAAPPRCDSS